MTKASDNAFPSILIAEGTEPSAPAAGHQRLYIDSTTHLIKATNSSGTDRTIEGVPAGAITTSGLTMATARLLGRTTASAGAIEEITVGSGLSLSAGSLTATGGSTIGSTLQSVNITGGNITLTGSTTTHTEVSTSLRLTVPAAAGDVLQIGCSILVTQGGTGEAIIDSATINTGTNAIINQCSPGTKHVGHLYTATALRSGGATLTYVVQAGDISGGNVTLSLTYINSDASAGTLRGASDYALRYWALNLGQ